MIYKNIEIHNVAELIDNKDGSVSWKRVPSSVSSTMEANGASNAVQVATGVELRFVIKGDCAKIKMCTLENNPKSFATFHVYRGGVQGGWRDHEEHCHVTGEVQEFVIDKSKNVEHLKETHYPLYETIRKVHKDTPIVFISKPDFKMCCYYVTKIEENAMRRQVIIDSYERAKANGDNNVYFIDGETLFMDDDFDSCTVDSCHPNDLGFFRMAQVIYPVLKEILESK